MAKERGFLYKLFNDLYEVEIVYADGSIHHYRLREIKKLNTQFLKGVDEDGHKIELSTTEPFNYLMKKLY